MLAFTITHGRDMFRVWFVFVLSGDVIKSNRQWYGTAGSQFDERPIPDRPYTHSMFLHLLNAGLNRIDRRCSFTQ